MSGNNPYSEAFNFFYFEHFGSQRASHFWVYPPYWFVPAAGLSKLEFEAAVLIWNLSGYLALWVGVASMIFALRLKESQTMMPYVLILVAVASLQQAAPFALSLGQSSLIVFLGVAFFITGVLCERSFLAVRTHKLA